MRIGELAKLSGLAASRIRFYESSGLITSVDRKANGYRDYGQDAVLILEIITGAQAAGFSLEEIRNLLPIGQNNWQHGELLDSLKRKVAEIEAMQARLEQNKAQLLVTIEVIESKPEGMQCGENTQRVLNRLRKEANGPAGSRQPVRED
ncbi:MerR family transcriptional regulator [Pseudomonas sp. BN414]|uniref:MerR family transcriptional regulator n=1 Tax=Pseudomonas sp. BN414 TaxID=2567888 RepID=UPI0024560B81|nr:MerR family transcriptional regulator [Pseudomonas sp. BN414]MDH4567513.1 MerR family transcriptional regulator [Pseudomonas sp. BN414]